VRGGVAREAPREGVLAGAGADHQELHGCPSTEDMLLADKWLGEHRSGRSGVEERHE
jgi:hypothetical protein